MPRSLDTIIGFVASTAIVFNLGTYLLPTTINRAFTDIIQITPRYVDTPSLGFTMVGRCYADEVWITCMDAIIELSRAGTLGYDQEQSVGNLRMMKPLIAAYSIFHGLLLVSCYALLACELSRTSKSTCTSCQLRITNGYKKFAAICMEITTVAGLAASGLGIWFALNLTSDQELLQNIDSRIGSGWILNLLATFGWLAATVRFSFDSSSRKNEHARTDGSDEVCETPVQPLEGLVDEKGGHIVLETV